MQRQQFSSKLASSLELNASCHIVAPLEALDRTLLDIKILLVNFRQTLPVIPKEPRADDTKHTLKIVHVKKILPLQAKREYLYIVIIRVS